MHYFSFLFKQCGYEQKVCASSNTGTEVQNAHRYKLTVGQSAGGEKCQVDGAEKNGEATKRRHCCLCRLPPLDRSRQLLEKH